MSYTSPSPLEIEERRAQLAWSDPHNERVLLALFATLCCWRGVPKSYLDLGSGTGAMVNMARKIGVESYGVDLISEGPGQEHWFIKHDLREPLHIFYPDLEGRAFHYPERYHDQNVHVGDHYRLQFEVITCLEVAEHIPREDSRTLVETIGRHLKRDGILVFSSASPGQQGEHHVNCRPSWEWRDMFYEVGVSYRPDLTRQLSEIWSLVAGPLQWLSANVQCFDA